MPENQIAIAPIAELKAMAAALGQNKMFGKTPEELLPLMLIAQAEGKHPAIAAQEYDIIQGRPALNAKSIQGRFQMAGGKVRWDVRTDAEVTVTVAHPQGGEVTITWNVERATRAGYMQKDNYKKIPQQMFAARAIAEAVRACYPPCLNGMYSREEAEDIDFETESPPPRDVTPEKKTMGLKPSEIPVVIGKAAQSAQEHQQEAQAASESGGISNDELF